MKQRLRNLLKTLDDLFIKPIFKGHVENLQDLSPKEDVEDDKKFMNDQIKKGNGSD